MLLSVMQKPLMPPNVFAHLAAFSFLAGFILVLVAAVGGGGYLFAVSARFFVTRCAAFDSAAARYS